MECDSPTVLKRELDAARKKVSLNETEDSWNTIAQGVSHLALLCKNGGCDFSSDMVAAIRSLSRPLNNALKSERSKLSGTAVELMTALAHGLGSSFEPLVSLFVPTLLDLCGRTNKVFASRARACVIAIIEHTQLPSLLSYLTDMAAHKSSFLRLTAAEGLVACLNCFNPPDLEQEFRARMIENFIRLAARDASADVRKVTKQIFEAYKALMPARVESFTAPLTPVIAKYLDVRNSRLGVGSDAPLVGHQRSSRPRSRTNEQHDARPASQNKVTHAQSHTEIKKTRSGPQTQGPRESRLAMSQTCAPTSEARSLSHRDGQNSIITQQSTISSRRDQVPLTRAPVRIPSSQGGTAPRVASRPQRPTSMHLKFKAPQDPVPEPTSALGGGARRVPLPLPDGSGQSRPCVQSATLTNRSHSCGAGVNSSNPPTRRAHEKISTTGPVANGGREAVRVAPLTGSSEKARATIPTGPMGSRKQQKIVDDGQTIGAVRGQQCTVRGSRALNNPSNKRPPEPRSRPPIKGLGKRCGPSPELIPLPPSPKIQSATALDCPQQSIHEDSCHDPAAEQHPKSDHRAVSLGPHQLVPPESPSRTPITALLSSIQRGFVFTPSSPLSPPQTYLPSVSSIAPLQDMNNCASISDLRGPWSNAEESQLPPRSLKQDFMDVLGRQALEAVNFNAQ